MSAPGRLAGIAALAISVSGLVACASGPTVTRVMDGRLVEGRFVEPEGYAVFLRGAIAEERGELSGAYAAYAAAAHFDDEDAEIPTRMAAVRCKIDPRDPAAETLLSRAFSIDSSYAGAFEVRAECALARGDKATAAEAARQATEAEPLARDLQILRARAEDGDPARDRLLALTLAHAESVAAWDALASWARSHGHPVLLSRALCELARRAPTKRDEVAETAAALAGVGELAVAREVSAALVDAALGPTGGAGISADRHPLTARLAVDAALLAADEPAARRRAVHTHLGLEEAAGRALLLGQIAIAEKLVSELVAADPRAAGAAMVLASATGKPFTIDDKLGHDAIQVASSAAIAYASHLARTGSVSSARAALDRFARRPLIAGDAVAVPAAVSLAARGALAPEELPLDARVELAARLGEPPPAAALARAKSPAIRVLDLRHEYLALSLGAPDSARARELAASLGRLRSTDPLIAVASARMELAGKAPPRPGAAGWLLARAPTDPLIAAAALDLARKVGDASAAARAKASLLAVAETAAEKARLRD